MPVCHMVALVSLLLAASPACAATDDAEQQAITAIEQLGGSVWRDPDNPGPIIGVNFSGPKITDSALEHLKGLTELTFLHLSGTKVTDAGLERLKPLTKLELLDLEGTQITDRGLEHLRHLHGLKSVDLHRTRITDQGLRHLTHLKQLEMGIVPNGTKLTPRPESIPSWESRSPAEKKVYSRLMEWVVVGGAPCFTLQNTATRQSATTVIFSQVVRTTQETVDVAIAARSKQI